MKLSNEPVRGTKDYLPKEMEIREEIKQKILASYRSFGFMQVGTPVLEDINRLLGSDGGDNLKLIFKVLKRGEKLNLSQDNLTERDIVDYGLKYDQTVSLVRLFSNNQNNLPSPFKSIQIDYAFRADRPQKGRLRQFTQCDIDILGDPTINAEIDIINTTAKTFARLGFKDFVARVNDRRVLSSIINSVGFDAESETDICISLDKLDKIAVSGVTAELLEKGYDEAKVNKLLENIERVKNSSDPMKELLNLGVNEKLVGDINTIISSVNALATNGFKAVFDITIIRGQGYYTGTVFEFFMPGFGGACAGGGRYDNMIEKMTGNSVPAVGLGLGLEPTSMLIAEQGLMQTNSKKIAVVYRPEHKFVDVLKYVQSLNADNSVSAILAKKNLNHQLEILKQNGFTNFVMFPETEIKPL